VFNSAITTSALETGVSLTDHYAVVFGMFRTFPLPHESQVQLANRARNAGHTMIYTEHGHRDALDADARALQSLFTLSAVCTEEVVLSRTFSTVAAESTDTFNNNDIIGIHPACQGRE
jgi:hypothetical protein